MGIFSSKTKYITVTLLAYNNIEISGFINNELKINTINNVNISNVIHDFNKFRKPDNRIYCINSVDNTRLVIEDMRIFVTIDKKIKDDNSDNETTYNSKNYFNYINNISSSLPMDIPK